MNLLKIQDALKNASDDQLMQLMQSPDSSAPSYLVLSEIRRRKDMRAQQQQEPQSTVAEDLASVPQTYDQAGIRSLRTPGYEEEERASPDDMQEMREGGVVRMAAGDEVSSEDEELRLLRERPFFERPFGRYVVEPLGRAFGQLIDPTGLGRRILQRPEPSSTELPPGTPVPGQAFREREQQIAAERPPLPVRGPRVSSSPTGPRGGGEFGEERRIPGEPGYTPSTSSGIPAIPDYTPDPMGSRQVYQTQAGPAAPSAGGGAGGGGAGIRGAGVGGGGFEDGVLAGMQRLEAAFPNNLAALREELEKGRTNPQERRREAQNLALMEAGLRMAASKNPSFLGSIGEGATPAVQSYAQQLGQIRQDERQDIRDRFSLEQANLQRMYALGQISAAEYRSRVAEAGANARAAAANETQRQISERQVTALESRERTAAANAEATTQRAMDAQLAQALRNPELRQQARMSLQADRAARGDRTPVTDAEINNAIVAYGIRPGMSSPQPQGSIVVTDGVQRYVR